MKLIWTIALCDHGSAQVHLAKTNAAINPSFMKCLIFLETVLVRCWFSWMAILEAAVCGTVELCWIISTVYWQYIVTILPTPIISIILPSSFCIACRQCKIKYKCKTLKCTINDVSFVINLSTVPWTLNRQKKKLWTAKLMSEAVSLDGHLLFHLLWQPQIQWRSMETRQHHQQLHSGQRWTLECWKKHIQDQTGNL